MLFSKISSKNIIFYLFGKYINFNKINIKIKIKKMQLCYCFGYVESKYIWNANESLENNIDYIHINE